MNRSLLELFVGRQQELAAIQDRVRRGGLQMVIVSGEGGIGKTHLLRRLEKLYADDPEILVVPIIDFDEVNNWVTQLVFRRIASELGDQHFPEYIKALRDLNTMISSGQFDAPRIREEDLRVEEKFFVEYAKLAQERRIILRLDTYDKVRDFEVGRELRERLGLQLVNTVIVVAGRRLESLADEVRRLYGQDNVVCLSLASFTPEESAGFFSGADLNGRIAEDLRRKIEFLAEDRPILLGLAVEWLRHDVPLPEMAARSLDELQALPGDALKALRERFEFELVGAVRALRQPRDQAVLYMAHFNRRCDAWMLALLMDRPVAEMASLVQELRTLFFVKPQPRLQDEVAKLVNQHVWPYVDPNGTVRADLTRRVVEQYYSPAIAALDVQLKERKLAGIKRKQEGIQLALEEQPAWEMWVLETERLHAQLWLDFVGGYDYFSQKFEQAIRGNYLPRCELLLDEVSGDEWKDELNANRVLHTNVQLKRARFLARSGTQGGAKKAEEICRDVLRQRRMNVQNRLEAWSTLGGVTPSSSERVRCYQKSVPLAKQLGDQGLIGDMARSLGWAHRRAGHWRQAANWYRQALKYHESQHPVDRRAIASTNNNLAYIYRLMGYVDRALEIGQTALKIRESYGTEREVALSCRTMGQIWSDQRDTWKAKEYFERAGAIFERLEARRDLAEVYVNIANIYRQQHRPQQVEEFLDKAIAIFQARNDQRGLADAFDEYGCEFRKRGRERSRSNEPGAEEGFAKAHNYFQQAIQLARASEDWYKLVDTLVDVILLRFYEGLHNRNIPAAFQSSESELTEAERLAAEYQFVLFQGRLLEFRGDFLQETGQVEDAYLKYYASACALLADYPSARYQETFKRVTKSLWELRLPPEQITTLCDGVIEFCRTDPKKRRLAPLARVCAQVKRLKGSEGDR